VLFPYKQFVKDLFYRETKLWCIMFLLYFSLVVIDSFLLFFPKDEAVEGALRDIGLL
jgi:hypothetical protein